MRTICILAASAAITTAFGVCFVRIRAQQAEIDRIRADVSALVASPEAKRASHRRDCGHVEERPGSTAPARRTSTPEEAVSDLPTAPPQPHALRAADRAPTEPKDMPAALESAFAEEAADPGWSSEAERTVQQKLLRVTPRASDVRSIECRSSMCRIETTHRDAGDYERFVLSAFKDPESQVWNGNAFSTSLRLDDRGGVVSVSYLAREGEVLLSLDAAESP
jgi:hypothetical protein